MNEALGPFQDQTSRLDLPLGPVVPRRAEASAAAVADLTTMLGPFSARRRAREAAGGAAAARRQGPADWMIVSREAEAAIQRQREAESEGPTEPLELIGTEPAPPEPTATSAFAEFPDQPWTGDEEMAVSEADEGDEAEETVSTPVGAEDTPWLTSDELWDQRPEEEFSAEVEEPPYEEDEIGEIADWIARVRSSGDLSDSVRIEPPAEGELVQTPELPDVEEEGEETSYEVIETYSSAVTGLRQETEGAPAPASPAPGEPEPPLLEEVASRLEDIAESLRNRSADRLFARDDENDPLKMLITGYALGYAEAKRAARKAPPLSS